MVTDQKPG